MGLFLSREDGFDEESLAEQRPNRRSNRHFHTHSKGGISPQVTQPLPRLQSLYKKASVGLADVAATHSRVKKLAELRGKKKDTANYTLLHAGENFGSEWLDALRAAGSDSAEVGLKLDMLVIGDYGKDLDDEKALAMAIALRRTGLVHSLSVIANLGNSSARARLAKGTATALGAHDVRVAIGSHTSREKSELHSYELDCPYIAQESELDPLGGHELAFDVITKCRDAGRKLAIVLCSALTDMAALLRDPRWEELAPGVVSHVTAMGGVVEGPDGVLEADPESANNSVDLSNARYVYQHLRDDPRFWFLIVTRHAAAECQLPRTAFDGSSHPVALRLTKAAAPVLQRLWERTHMTEVERILAHEPLPMSRNPEWFRTMFLEASAPRTLGKNDAVWRYVRGFSEYDGLAVVAAATVMHPELFTMFFRPFCHEVQHVLILGRSPRETGIIDGHKVGQLLHFLIATSMGPGSGEWFGRLCDHNRPVEGLATDMLMYGDFGKDQDDEKALVMAVAMRRTGLIGDLTVVANLGDSLNRARLAKGTLNALGAHDVKVARGSDGGRPGEEIHDYEFDACPYLAPESELYEAGGHELAFAAMALARERGRKITIVLCSSPTDMAALIKDPRWEELAPNLVSHVVSMGGTLETPEGEMRVDPESSNNCFDLKSAEFVYNYLREDPRFDLIVVTRFAARECQLPKKAFDGSSHPIALRLTAVAKPSLQTLWQRVHRTAEERRALKDGLPLSRDPAWFRDNFLVESAPKNLNGHNDIWEYVRGFTEYDGLATVVAATATFPNLYNHFFKPHQYPDLHTWVIGRNATEIGITERAKASELLHDLLVTAFHAGGRFRKGYFVEIRSSPLVETWQLVVLEEPARGQGPDCWMGDVYSEANTCNGPIYRIPVYLTRSTEGVLWRLAHRLGDREPLEPNLRVGIRYRLVGGVRTDPYHITQAVWTTLRRGFEPQQGDVWVTGFPGNGNMMMQFMVRMLMNHGNVEAVVNGPYASGISNSLEMDVAVGKVTLKFLNDLAPGNRVFTSHQVPTQLPCKGLLRSGGSRWSLHPGIKCIHPVRDPRDACRAYWRPGNCSWEVFARAYADCNEMPWKGYLQQNMEWWEGHLEHPDQILWVTFEECKRSPEATVRNVAKFLGLNPSDEVVAKTVASLEFDQMKVILERHKKLAHGGKIGDFSSWSKPLLTAFQDKMLQPIRESGMRIALADSSIDTDTSAALS